MKSKKQYLYQHITEKLHEWWDNTVSQIAKNGDNTYQQREIGLKRYGNGSKGIIPGGERSGAPHQARETPPRVAPRLKGKVKNIGIKPKKK